MRIKSFLVIAVLATAILCSGGVIKAQVADNSALIAQLQAQIQSLMQQIAALQAQQGGGQTWCHTFNVNMGYGAAGPDFDALITVLDREGIMEFTSANRPVQSNENIGAGVVKLQAKYGILQTGYVGTLTRAKLNSLYGCATTPSTTQPTIKITNPNGGENWKIGETRNINWTSNNVNSGAKVQLQLVTTSFDNPDNRSMVLLITQATNNTGNYSWTIPSNVPAGQYLIYALANTDDTASRTLASDFSNNTFTISAPGTVSCIDSDNGLLYFMKGTLNGVYNGSPITLSDFCVDRTSSTNGQTVSQCSGVNCQLGERSCNSSNATDYVTTYYTCPNGCSDGVCVQTTTQPAITSISPSSGLVGSTITITGSNFTSTGNTQALNTVTFSCNQNLTSGPSTYGNISPNNVSTDGKTLTLVVPSIFAFPLSYTPTYPINCILVVTNANGTSVGTNSTSFSITAPSPTALTVSCSASPNAITAGQSATFTPIVSGGTGSYTYSWWPTGSACAGSTASTCTTSYPSAGTQTTHVTVVSGNQSVGATCSVNVVAPVTALYVSCSASPNAITAGQSATFTPIVSGGTGSYTYSWTNACVGTASTCSKTFSTTGTQTAMVTVVSGNQSVGATCSVNVVAPVTALFVSCSASPSSITTGQTATFTPTFSGGTGSYTYSWWPTGSACAGSTASTCTASYPSAGTQTTHVTVLSGNQSVGATCSVNVSAPALATATLQIILVSPYPTAGGATVSVNGGTATTYTTAISLNAGSTFAVTAKPVTGYTTVASGNCTLSSPGAVSGQYYACSITYAATAALNTFDFALASIQDALNIIAQEIRDLFSR